MAACRQAPLFVIASATVSRSAARTRRFVDLDLRHTFATGLANTHVGTAAKRRRQSRPVLVDPGSELA